MAKVYANRVWMTTATAGTGTITLGSAKAGYLTFAQGGVANADTVTYVLIDGNNFEIGTGTYTSAGTTMSRDTVHSSLISGTPGTTKLTLSGSAEVFLAPKALDMAFLDTANTFTQSQTINADELALTSGTNFYPQITATATFNDRYAPYWNTTKLRGAAKANQYDDLGSFIFRSADNGGTIRNAALLVVLSDGGAASTHAGYFVFATTDTSGNELVARMNLLSNGDLGVGIVPTTKFHILGTTSTHQLTDAGASAGPVHNLFRDSASPAASDIIGEVQFTGRDSAANAQEYANITAVITSPTSTAETGDLTFQTVNAGTVAEKFRIASHGGLGIGGATYGTAADYFSSNGSAAPSWNPAPLRGHIWGLTMSNNGTDAVNDIDIAAGAATDEGHAYVMVLAASITKRLDAAWAVGTNQGGLNTGAEANSTWYEVHLIRRPDTGVVDVMFTTTANRATLPANYTQQRRIGWIRNDGSGNILPFTQVDDHFTLTTQINDVAAAINATAAAATVTVPPRCIGRFRGGLNITAVNTGLEVAVVFSEIAEGNVTPTATTAIATLAGSGTNATAATNDDFDGGHFELRVDASSQIEWDCAIGTGGTGNFDLSTFGWIDMRRRLSAI